MFIYRVNTLTHFPSLVLLQGVAKESAQYLEAKWILVSHEFPCPHMSPNHGGWRSATTCSTTNLLWVHTNPLPPQVQLVWWSQGRLSCHSTLSLRWSPPAQPCQPWGHAPPCSTKQLQCRRESGSAIYGRSAHWTPFQSTRHRQTRLCSLAHKWVFIWSSADCLSCRRLPLSFPSPGAGENTGAEAKDSWIPVQLLILTHCLALLSHLTSLPLVLLLKRDKELDLTRQDSSPQETNVGGSLLESRGSSLPKAADPQQGKVQGAELDCDM